VEVKMSVTTKKLLRYLALILAMVVIFSVFLIFVQDADTASAAELAKKIFGVVSIAVVAFFGIFSFR